MPPPQPTEPDPPARAEAIFNSALARPPDEREAILAEACGEDAALLAEVRALLAAHDGAGEFMHETRLLTPEMERGLAQFEPEKAGERIGRYKLLQQIGEGGFGTVWMLLTLQGHDSSHLVRGLFSGRAPNPHRTQRRDGQVLGCDDGPRIAQPSSLLKNASLQSELS